MKNRKIDLLSLVCNGFLVYFGVVVILNLVIMFQYGAISNDNMNVVSLVNGISGLEKDKFCAEHAVTVVLYNGTLIKSTEFEWSYKLRNELYEVKQVNVDSCIWSWNR